MPRRKKLIATTKTTKPRPSRFDREICAVVDAVVDLVKNLPPQIRTSEVEAKIQEVRSQSEKLKEIAQ